MVGKEKAERPCIGGEEVKNVKEGEGGGKEIESDERSPQVAAECDD